MVVVSDRVGLEERGRKRGRGEREEELTVIDKSVIIVREGTTLLVTKWASVERRGLGRLREGRGGEGRRERERELH